MELDHKEQSLHRSDWSIRLTDIDVPASTGDPNEGEIGPAPIAGAAADENKGPLLRTKASEILFGLAAIPDGPNCKGAEPNSNAGG
jgi:hypothetical protein